MSKLLSPLAQKAPAFASDIEVPDHLPPPPSITVKPSSEAQSLLPVDVPVNEALKFIDVNPRSEKTALTPLSKALQKALSPLGPFELAVTEAKKEVVKLTEQRASPGKARRAESQLKDAEIKLRDAEARRDAVAKCMNEFSAGRLTTILIDEAIAEAKKRVERHEIAKGQAKGEALELVNRLLEGAHAELQGAEAQKKLADDAGINDEWKRDVFAAVPERLRGFGNHLAKMNWAAAERDAWLSRVSGSLSADELQILQMALLAAGAQVGTRLEMFAKDLVERATTEGKEGIVKYGQKEIQAYCAKNGTLRKQINEALAVLSRFTDREAVELRSDLERLVVELEDPKGAAQQMLHIGNADPDQVIKLIKQLRAPPSQAS